MMTSLSADGPTDSLGASSPTDKVHGSALSTSSDASRSCIARYARDSVCSPLQVKPVLAPPMFIFQRLTAPVKRRSEEEGNGEPRLNFTKGSPQVLQLRPASSGWNSYSGGFSLVFPGATMNKRARSLTCPSLPSRPRKGPCDNGRRLRSSSLSSPPPLPVSRTNVFMPSNIHHLISVSACTVPPQAKVKHGVARPSDLTEQGQDSSHDTLHHHRVEELSRVHVPLRSSHSTMEEQTLPQTTRTLSQTTTTICGSVQFVFGENMSERVLSPLKSPCSEDTSETDCSTTDSDSSSSESSNTMTLWESAAACTNACRRRCLPKQVQVFTGEENESNVVQLTCKLFVLERGTQSWRERGRGILRLNDLKRGTKGCLQSRMVMRHEGNLKVILNTKLYAHTHLRRPARRTLQVTATDVESRTVRVFLIQAGARDVARLYVAVHHRLVALRRSPVGATLGGGVSAAAATAPMAALADREGTRSSAEEEDNEEEEAEEEATLITRVRSGDCNWRHNHSRLCP